VNDWWQRRSLRVRLAAWYAATGAGAWLACLLVTAALGVWRPGSGGNLLLALGIGCAGSLALCGAGGYWLAGRALAPVKEMAERTRLLSANSLSERLPVANSHDELGKLAAVFNQTLEQLERAFAESKRFSADVSHELRTPLTAMRAVGEVAIREGNPALIYDALGSMLEEVGRMNQLIERLLLLARGEGEDIPLRMEAGLVRPVLTEISDSLSLVAQEKQQQTVVDCPDHLLAVFDPALLRLALVNLVQNAIRYSPAGKPITLRGRQGHGEVVLEVADEGPGIALEHQGKVFERFYRVDKARSRAEGGAGLGLAIVKWAAERMGGEAELQSEPGRGSTFRLRLCSLHHKAL
jgi:signal transduction histidine kinase